MVGRGQLLVLAAALAAVVAGAGVIWAKTITGTAGSETLRGSAAADRLYGKGGNDRLYGGGGGDRLYGGAGDDLLVGGPGADLLVGGAGGDTLRCGAGRDTALTDVRDRVAGDCEVVRGPKPSWSSPIALTPSGVISAALAASGATLFMAYQHDGQVLFRRSTNQGATWSAPDAVGRSDELPLTEALAADGQSLHLVFARSNDLIYKRSTDGGRSWGQDIPLGSASGGGFFRVSLDVERGRVHVAWVSHRKSDFTTAGLFYRRSLDGGGTWQPTRQLVERGNDPGRPALSVVGNNVHLVWTDERDRNPPCYTYPACPEVYYARSLDGGATWGSQRRLTAGKGNTIGRPDVVALTTGEVVLVWQDDGNVDGQEELYARRSPDHGSNWSGTQRLTNAPKVSEHPMISALGRTVLVAWFDGRAEPKQVYARLSANGGRTWAPEERVTKGGVASLLPYTGVTRGFVHLLISQEDAGIAYSRRPR